MGQPPAGFLPSRHGLAFSNSWPSAPAVSLATPFGTIGIGDAARGLCGGMVFAALDYWHAQAAPPQARPAPGTPLFRFIVRRLVDSWRIPAGVARYYRWMNLPDGNDTFSVLGKSFPGRPGVSRRTIERQWPQVKARLDGGQPAALGLVTVATADPRRLGQNHQVLAYGYRLAGSEVTMQVYDPNTGQDDGVHIRFAASAPDGAATFAHNINIGWPVRGFFLTGYSPAAPPRA
jgi:hypothetical protein